ncbi:MAG: carboxypeptidase regulatory-like domain-containing protein, partial [Hymenobacter sp.]
MSISEMYDVIVASDSTVRADSSNVPNIRSYMLLCGNLAGLVEDPGYYFEPGHADRFSSLDLLLLTQGWSGYSWQQVFQSDFQPVYRPEQALQLSGQISRTGGKAIAGLPVMLLSTHKPLIMMDTVSDQNGRFVFSHLPPYDTASFMVQVKDRKGKMFEATVQVDQFIPAKVSLQKQPDAAAAPWYVNAQSESLDYLKASQAYTAYRDSLTYGTNAIRLKGVTIRAIKSVRGSQNLNGPGKADQVLDETDLKKAGKMTLMELLYQKIKGFRPYAIYDKLLKFVFDGIDLDFFYQKETEPNYSEYLQRNIDLFNAEDIRGIEVMYNNDYTGTYTIRYDPDMLPIRHPAYIEIT